MVATPQQYHQNMVHFLRRTVNFNDVGIATGLVMGRLPANAQIIDAVARVKTAFNAATTNVLTVGTNASTYDNVMAAGDITEGTPGNYRTAVAGLIDVTADTDLLVRYTQSGTPATTGQAIITVAYSVKNEADD